MKLFLILIKILVFLFICVETQDETQLTEFISKTKSLMHSANSVDHGGFSENIDRSHLENEFLNVSSTEKNVTNSTEFDKKDTLSYTCYNCIDFPCQEPFPLCHNAAMCFSYKVPDSFTPIRYYQGCIANPVHIPFFCLQPLKEPFEMDCCKGNYCNNYTLPDLKENESSSKSGIIIGCIIGTAFCFTILALIIVFILKKKAYKRRKRHSSNVLASHPLVSHSSTFPDEMRLSLSDSTIPEMFSESISSGSGQGLPAFVQRTLAKTIHLEEKIAEGRYGQVCRGSLKGNDVAVKIFSTKDESSWRRETDIYSTVLLSHENILSFYGSDTTSVSSSVQLWLVTHYYPKGSLNGYLKSHVLTYEELIVILMSILKGLYHLHSEISGTQRKPAIAHRDIKSRNILVKEDGSCCLADFGLAVLRCPTTGEINIGNNLRVGTKRYMSPEVLQGTLNTWDFDTFRKSDIYSLALVMWECCGRCSEDGDEEKYSLPYEREVGSEPSFEEMERTVCFYHTRPEIPPRWMKDKILSRISCMLMECWHYNPSVRLTALRIKKNLAAIANEELDMKVQVN